MPSRPGAGSTSPARSPANTLPAASARLQDDEADPREARPARIEDGARQAPSAGWLRTRRLGYATRVRASQHALAGPGRAATRQETLALEGSRPFRWLVRSGFIARGLTYGLIGSVAIALAAGARSEPARPDQQGALSLLAHATLGR